MECPIVFFFLLMLLLLSGKTQTVKKTPFVKHLIEPGGTSFIPLVKLSRRFGENQKTLPQQINSSCQSISFLVYVLVNFYRFDLGQAN